MKDAEGRLFMDLERGDVDDHDGHHVDESDQAMTPNTFGQQHHQATHHDGGERRSDVAGRKGSLDVHTSIQSRHVLAGSSCARQDRCFPSSCSACCASQR